MPVNNVLPRFVRCATQDVARNRVPDGDASPARAEGEQVVYLTPPGAENRG